MYRAYTTLLEDMSSVPAPTLGGHSNFGDPSPLASEDTCTHRDIHIHPIYVVKIIKINLPKMMSNSLQYIWGIFCTIKDFKTKFVFLRLVLI